MKQIAPLKKRFVGRFINIIDRQIDNSMEWVLRRVWTHVAKWAETGSLPIGFQRKTEVSCFIVDELSTTKLPLILWQQMRTESSCIASNGERVCDLEIVWKEWMRSTFTRGIHI